MTESWIQNKGLIGMPSESFTDDDNQTFLFRDNRVDSNVSSDGKVHIAGQVKLGSGIKVDESTSEGLTTYTVTLNESEVGSLGLNPEFHSVSIISDGDNKNYLAIRCQDSNTYYLRIDEHGLSANTEKAYSETTSKRILYTDSDLEKLQLNVPSTIAASTIEASDKLSGNSLAINTDKATITNAGLVTAKGGYYLNELSGSNKTIKTINTNHFTIDSDGKLSLNIEQIDDGTHYY